MGKSITVTLVANAGVLVEYGDIRFLIDALHREEDSNFSGVLQEQLLAMTQGDGKLRDVEYLLFSHEHPDHITPVIATEYLRCNMVKKVFLQQNGSLELQGLQKMMRNNKIPSEMIHLPEGGVQEYALGEDGTVVFTRTRHMGASFLTTEHYSIVLRLGGQSLLFTADADYCPENFAPLQGMDTVFVNPLFYHNSAGRAVLEEVIRPRKVVVYHVPFSQDDRRQYRKMVQRSMERYPGRGFDVTCLSEPEQRLVLRG